MVRGKNHFHVSIGKIRNMNGRSFSLFVIFGFYVQYFCYLIYGIFRSRSGWNFRHPLSGSFI